MPGPRDPAYRAELRRGALAVVPLWLGVLPFGVAFALLGRTAGFDAVETQAFSALVFAGSAQVAAATLTAGGAGVAAVLLTTLVLNLRHVLYGLALGAGLPRRTHPPRAALAFLLTDEVYGLAAKEQLEGRDGRRRDAFLLGAGLSLYVTFNLSTLAGVLAGAALPSTDELGLDFVFPLVFLALLVPLLRAGGPGGGVAGRRVVVALAAGALALALRPLVPAGVTILGATLAGAALGARLDRDRDRDAEPAGVPGTATT